MTINVNESVYQPRLILNGRPDFICKTNEALNNIAAINLGNQLLQSLIASQKTTTILESTGRNLAVPTNFNDAIAQGQILEWKELYGKQGSLIGSGTGSDTTIHYNPNCLRIGTNKDWQLAPASLWLVHELIHADDAAWGRMDPAKIDGLHNYERQAVGLPPYELKEFTENRFRTSWLPLQPPRTGY